MWFILQTLKHIKIEVIWRLLLVLKATSYIYTNMTLNSPMNVPKVRLSSKTNLVQVVILIANGIMKVDFKSYI